MKLFLLTIVDSLRPIPQYVEMWGDENTSPELVAEKAKEFTARFIKSDAVSVPLNTQIEADRMYYSPVGNAQEEPSDLAYVTYTVDHNARFNPMNRNATQEHI